MTLWILFCRMTNEVDTLFTFYAKDRHHAELKAEELLDWYGYERIDLKEYPGGFRMVQQLLGRPSLVPNSPTRRGTFADVSPTSPTAPTAPLPRSSIRAIERSVRRDPVGEQIVTGNVAKCSYLATIEVSSHQFQESGVLCVECPTCGARRSFKVPKEWPRFPSHPRRQSPPPKGERRWVLQGQAWIMVDD